MTACILLGLAALILPPESAEILPSDFFTDPESERDAVSETIAGNAIRFRTTAPLAPGEGLTG